MSISRTVICHNLSPKQMLAENLNQTWSVLHTRDLYIQVRVHNMYAQYFPRSVVTVGYFLSPLASLSHRAESVMSGRGSPLSKWYKACIMDSHGGKQDPVTFWTTGVRHRGKSHPLEPPPKKRSLVAYFITARCDRSTIMRGWEYQCVSEALSSKDSQYSIQYIVDING